MKQKTDNLDFTKIKNFCFAKDSIEDIRKQVTDWERMYAKHT